MTFASNRYLKRRMTSIDPTTALGQWYEETYRYTQLATDTGGTIMTVPAGFKNITVSHAQSGKTDVISVNESTGVITLTGDGSASSLVGYVTVKYALA